MTGFAFAAVLFGVIGLGIILYTITYTPKASPGSGQSGATSSGRDGARKVRDDLRARTTVLADNPPGTPLMVGTRPELVPSEHR